MVYIIPYFIKFVALQEDMTVGIAQLMVGRGIEEVLLLKLACLTVSME